MSVLVVQSSTPSIEISKTQPVIGLSSGLLNSGTAGAVTSVALTVPSDLTVTGSPVTGAGTLAVSRNTQSANLFLAGPSSGAAAAPTYRAIVPADVPLFVASGASAAAGLVPSPGATAGTSRFLREDASWDDAVTSVGLSDSTGLFVIAGSPVTTSGTLSLSSLATQSANKVFAGPASGSAVAPTFRSIVPNDLPVFVASGASAAAGAVPSPGTTAGNTRYLREDATWDAPNGTGNDFTFTPQATPTLAPGITWGDSTQNALQTYIDGASGWIPTVLMCGTAITAISFTAATATSILPTSYVGTLTLPANFLVVGKTIKISVRGYVTTGPASNSTVSPSLIIGSTTIGGGNNGTGFDTSAKVFALEYTLTCLTTGTSGTVMTSIDAGADGSQSALTSTTTMWEDGNNGASSTVNTTVANALNVKLNCSVATSISVTHAMIEVIA